MPADVLGGIYISLVTGVGYGLIISLLAAGMSLIYGVTHNVNTAHGAFYLLGGFFAFLAGRYLNAPPALAIVLAFVFVFLFGVGLLGSRIVPKRMWVISNEDDQNIALMLLLGFATIVQYVAFIVFGGGSAAVPSIFFGSVDIGGVYLSHQYLFAVAISVLSYVFLYLLLSRSKLGKAIRAFSQDRKLAEAVGVNVNQISLLTFGIGVSLAGLTGSLLASIYSVTSSAGWDQLVIAFVIVTFGGIGSIVGSLIAGVIYGVAYSMIQFYYPSLSFVITLFLIYVILIIRPKGLLGEEIERA